MSGREKIANAQWVRFVRLIGNSHFFGVLIDHVRLDVVNHTLHRTLLHCEGGAVAVEGAPLPFLPPCQTSLITQRRRVRDGGGGGGGGGGGLLS